MSIRPYRQILRRKCRQIRVGTVPIGGLLAGVAIEAFSVTAVVLVGAGVALGLAAYADLSPGPEAPPPRQA